MQQGMVCTLRKKEAYYDLVTVISMAETLAFWPSLLVASSVVIAHIFSYGAKSDALFDASLRYLSQSSSTHF